MSRTYTHAHAYIYTHTHTHISKSSKSRYICYTSVSIMIINKLSLLQNVTKVTKSHYRISSIKI